MLRRGSFFLGRCGKAGKEEEKGHGWRWRRRRRRRRRWRNMQGGVGPTTDRGEERPATEGRRRRTAKAKLEERKTKSLVVSLGCCSSCFAPFFLSSFFLCTLPRSLEPSPSSRAHFHSVLPSFPFTFYSQVAAKAVGRGMAIKISRRYLAPIESAALNGAKLVSTIDSPHTKRIFYPRGNFQCDE